MSLGVLSKVILTTNVVFTRAIWRVAVQCFVRLSVTNALSENSIWLRAAYFPPDCPDVHRELHRRYNQYRLLKFPRRSSGQALPGEKPLALAPDDGVFRQSLYPGHHVSTTHGNEGAGDEARKI